MRHDDLDDRELVARYQQGDTAAGEALVVRYRDDVRAYCFAVLYLLADRKPGRFGYPQAGTDRAGRTRSGSGA